MPGSWTLGSAGALLTLAWNAVSEAQPSSLDRSGHSIRAMHERPSWSSVPRRVQSAAAEVPRNRFSARLVNAETSNHLGAVGAARNQEERNMLRIMHRVYGPALPAAFFLIGIGTVGIGGAAAQGSPEARQACTPDAMRLCSISPRM
jgi:hypothetical protein